jgi:hypothetical protein
MLAFTVLLRLLFHVFTGSPEGSIMTPFQKRLTPITKRMAGDMLLRNMSLCMFEKPKRQFLIRKGCPSPRQLGCFDAR